MSNASEKTPNDTEIASMAPRVVDVARLSAKGQHVMMTLNEAEDRSVCEFLDLIEITAFKAELKLERVKQTTLRLTGKVRADVVQRCVVSLAPVPSRVEEDVNLTLVPADSLESYIEKTDEEGALMLELDQDVPDTYEGEKVDVGAFAIEHLALGLNPYPHAEGAEMEAGADNDDPGQSPFAELLSLKDKLKPN